MRRLLLILCAAVSIAVLVCAEPSGAASRIGPRNVVSSAGNPSAAAIRGSLARRNGRIVYADPGLGRGWMMFTVNAEGHDKKLLTRDGGIRPQWSPDGTKLLFTRGDHLFVMRAGPGAVRRFLIKGPINGAAGVTAGIPELAAHWSPDGRRIVFATVRGIEVANADGSGRRVLLRTRPRQLYFGDPDWSPDGRQIVLQGNQFAPLTWPSVPEQIYLMRSDGTGLRQLTYGFIRFHENPSWSRDGRRIVFARCPVPWATSRVSELVLLKPDGSDQRTIARLPGTDCVRMITWSPDGRKILYLNERTGVEVMNIDGSARRRLLPWALGVSGFSWQAPSAPAVRALPPHH
jgi:Tol biopolymer transport system component